MRFFKQLPLVFPALFLFLTIQGQDKIYMATDIRQGRITEVNAAVVKYQNPYNTRQTLLMPAREALIVFNHKGDYLIPSKLDPANEISKKLVARFLSADSTLSPEENDQIFTNKKTRINSRIVSEDSHFVYLPDSLKLDKSSIVAIIYKNGQQKIFGNIDSVAAILWAVQQSTLTPALPQPVAHQQQPSAGGNAAITTFSPPGAKGGEASSTADSARERAFAEMAGNISRKEFEDRSVQKTNKLNEYLKILCSKSASAETSNEATDQAINLFVNENAMVETSSIKENIVHHYKIRQYLTKVKLFKYDKIEIEWTHVQYVSDLKLGPDGNYYGVVTFEQLFRGYRDNQLVYSDITRKNANVVLKTYKKNYEGTTKTIWDVLLSDIGVVYTKSSDNN